MTPASARLGVVRFPGSNCDRDVLSLAQVAGYQADFLWHLDHFNIQDYQALVLPGGFSYGDYLRAGALSARSPVMNSVRDFAKRGGPVLGICNGFQVLTEAGLLPGALVKNSSLRFRDGWVDLVPENKSSFWASQHSQWKVGGQLKLPIAHGEGRFYSPPDLLRQIEDSGQVWFRYADNPNGSLANIAGVLNETGNVAGLMPHPERALWDWMGSEAGRGFLR